MNPLVVIIQFIQVGIHPNVQHSPRGAVNHGSKIQLAQRCRVIKDGTDIATLVVSGVAAIVLLSKYLRDRIGIEQLTRGGTRDRDRLVSAGPARGNPHATPQLRPPYAAERDPPELPQLMAGAFQYSDHLELVPEPSGSISAVP